MSRKDTLRAMLGNRDDRLPHGNTVAASVDRPHSRSGAVGAMGRSLGQIATAAEQAKALVASGMAVVEITTDKLEGSFVADRFAGSDVKSLIESIRAMGQQVPILVRPHPEKPGRYQIAYGHRRVRALAELGLPARAVVKVLSDEELVVAQGQENSARTDLSYIERARFASALAARGFERAVIMSALNMEKTQLSRLLSVARLIPGMVADAIGPAPKAGRPRWDALAQRFEQIPDADLSSLLVNERFIASDTDARFNKVFESMAPKKESVRPRTTPWKNERGEKVAVVERSETRIAVITHAHEFGEFIAKQLPDLYRDFEAQKGGDAPSK